MDNGHDLKLSAAELDAALTAAQNALPRDGSASMYGGLGIINNNARTTYSVDGDNSPYAFLNVYRADDYGRRRTLMLSSRQNSPDLKQALALSEIDETGWKDYPILHTGNKPSGSYTGNGDATSRTIETGGIGRAVLIWSTESNANMVLLGPVGGIAKSTSGVVAIGWSHASVFNNNIVLSTTDERLNANGVTYNYQVL